MKRISLFPIIVTTLILSNTILAQESKVKSDSLRYRIGKSVPVPEATFRPKLPLQKALHLAEQYIKKRSIDITRHYLFKAGYSLFDSVKSDHWSFCWISEHGTDGDYVNMAVSMTGKVKRVPPHHRIIKRIPIPLDTTSHLFQPAITLQEALRIAEEYIDGANIDIKPFYLDEAVFTLFADKEPSWYFWWCNENGAMGNYVELIVFMDGKVRRLPSM